LSSKVIIWIENDQICAVDGILKNITQLSGGQE